MRVLDRLLRRKQETQALTDDDRLKFNALHRQEHVIRRLEMVGIDVEVRGGRVGKHRSTS